MPRTLLAATIAALVALATVAGAQTATELKKELLPQIRKAEAEGKDLGGAKEEYTEGDKALRDGMQDEAIEHFKKAKALMPK